MPKLIEELKKHQQKFHPVISFDPSTEKIMSLDLSKNNIELTGEIYSNQQKFLDYIRDKLKTSSAKFAIGGYNENRNLYKMSKLFGTGSPKVSPKGGDLEGAFRTLHLGIDIWGEEGTKIYAPMGGMVHSFAFNDDFGDYGVTIILSHQLEGVSFYTLYGHLSLKDISSIKEGYYIIRGQEFAHFGSENENGHWPPHLHFQVIKDMGVNKGDYPGVCTFTEREKYLSNCPDPDSVLQLIQYL